MGETTPVVKVSNTPLTPQTTQATGTSGYATANPQLFGGSGAINAYYLPTHTSTTDTAQTSPQDIAALINSTMQSLVGRFATPEEIKTYGAELLAAQRANPGTFSGQTTYAISGKRNTVTGATVSSGVSPQGFFENLINGTAEAAHYRVINGYLGALQQLSDSSKVG